MSNSVIFAHPRTVYGSYVDLRTLIAVNEYPTCFVDEIDPDSDNCYIVYVSNGETVNGWQNPKARIILWDFEHRIEDGSYPNIPGVAERWHMDAAQARQHGVRYVPLGGDARLRDYSGDYTNDTRNYDVAFLAYMTNRRLRIYDDLLQTGLLLTETSAWGARRDHLLSRSKVYCHVHQLDNAPGVPALRLVVAAAYGLPVISERFADAGVFAGLIAESSYDVLVRNTRYIVDTLADVIVDRLSERLSNFLNTEYTFANGIAAHV